ncbi:hypothetical protein PIB30_077992 [Stylosanthes scabra]|uniref:DUF4218 domain-containing protein n=1 Tax=Stylosanthes scabra TaxID=79078 RepID=A0ABU6RR15_9FABA|nr:hypothetical protein [Stylosanthes scabra]
MVHLIVDLVDEMRLGGTYVRNRAQAEGSIVGGYLSMEILTFYSRYLDNVETRINRPVRLYDCRGKIGPGEKDTMFLNTGKFVPMESGQYSNELKWLARGLMVQARCLGNTMSMDISLEPS